jgi:anaerobic magnesium-protoporphyrin IX monomethyl ester cyclase
MKKPEISKSIKEKNKRILLINPGYTNNPWSAYLNPGIGYLAESLEKNKIEYDFFDMNLYPYERLIKKIDEFRPDILGISMMTYNYINHYNLINKLKNKYPDKTIIVGGAHASLFKEKIMSDCPGVDILMIGEGECLLVDICKGKNLKNIPNIVYRKGERVVKNKEACYIQNLDEIPFPKYKKFEIDKCADKTIPIVSSRGCPYSCTYCTTHMSVGKKVRARSAKNVVDEIEYWYKKGYRYFNFSEDNFTFYKERVHEICDEIEKKGLKNLKLDCAGIRADKLDYNLLKRMRKIGWYSLSIGVEAGNDKMLEVLKKGEKIKDIEKAIEDALSLGYSITLYFILGFPRQTIKDVKDTFALAKKYPVANSVLHSLIPYPGTELYYEILRDGKLLYKPEQYLNSSQQMHNVILFETKELNKKQREWMMREADNIMGEVKKNALVRRYKKVFPLNYFVAYIGSNQNLERALRKMQFLRKFRFEFSRKFANN